MLSALTIRPPHLPHILGLKVLHCTVLNRLGVEQGADFIECDVCITKDLVPICRHQSWLNHTTNVWEKQNLRSKVKTYNVFDPSTDTTKTITDIFTVDLTLQEIKTIGVKQRYSFRDPNYDGLYTIPTLEEYIQVAKSADRTVGIYPEIKGPEWVNSLDILRNANTTFEDVVTEVLHKNGYREKESPCYVQSFSERSIRALATKTKLPLVMLIETTDPIPEARLENLSAICAGIGVWKNMIIPQRDKYLQRITDLVTNAHKYNLKIHPYTFRNEDRYLAWNYTQDPYNEYQTFLDIHVDGYFTDFPATLKRFLDVKYSTTPVPSPSPCVSGAPGISKGGFSMLPLVLIVAFVYKSLV